MQARPLIISFDNNLADSTSSDTEERFVDYSKNLKVLDVIIPNSKTKSERNVTSNFTLYPICGTVPARALKTIFQGVSLVRKHDLNLIITNDPTLGFLGWVIKIFTGAKLNINVFSLNGGWLEFFTLKKADSIRVDSKREKDKLINLGFDSQKITVIPVIPAKSRLEAFKKLKLKNSKIPTILSVGFLIKQKDYKTLIKAASFVIKEIPTAQFKIIGSGPERENLIKLIGNLNITIENSVPVSLLPSLYQDCSVFVTSSLFEGGPRVVMEAGLAGKPIVSTDVGAVPDMLENDYSGIIVPIGNPDSLAKGILEVLKNPKKAKIFGERARQALIKYCDYEKNRSELLALWEKTI